MTVSVTACDYPEIQCGGSLTAHSLYSNLCSGAQKKRSLPRDQQPAASLLTPCLMTRRAVIVAALGGEPPICIQNVARHRWQAERGGGHQRSRLLLCTCRPPPHPTLLRPPPKLRRRFRGLVSVGLLYEL